MFFYTNKQAFPILQQGKNKYVKFSFPNLYVKTSLSQSSYFASLASNQVRYILSLQN